MLYGAMTHPELLRAIGVAGHGAKILIADSNYPHATLAHPRSEMIYLNLAPGLINATDILDVIKETVPLEAAEVMVPDDGTEVPIHDEFRAALPDVEFIEHGRWDFYDVAKAENVAVVIASGESRIYANLLLTIGVRMPEVPVADSGCCGGGSC
ncbi:MAG: RbsD or FucU transport [Arachnia propionica]|nr:MAG: RbsD or FucU transport [Arachnia propionica]